MVLKKKKKKKTPGSAPCFVCFNGVVNENSLNGKRERLLFCVAQQQRRHNETRILRATTRGHESALTTTRRRSLLSALAPPSARGTDPTRAWREATPEPTEDPDPDPVSTNPAQPSSSSVTAQQEHNRSHSWPAAKFSTCTSPAGRKEKMQTPLRKTQGPGDHSQLCTSTRNRKNENTSTRVAADWRRRGRARLS